MRFLLKVIIILVIACLIASLSRYGTGHVIVFIGKTRLDVALSTLVISIFILFVLLYYLIRFIVNINRFPNKIKQWRLKNALIQSRKQMNSAAINYFEGKFGSAYKNALNSTNKEINKDSQFLALMLCYKSSSFMRNHEKEETVLTKLEAFKERKWQLAKYVAIAENQYANRQYNQCLDNLNKAIAIDKKHIPSRRIMLKTYINLKNFDKALEELNWLIKHNYIEKYKADKYKLTVYSNLFATVSDELELLHFYRKLDKLDKENMVINRFYFNALIRLKLYDKALEVLEDTDKNGLVFSETIIQLVKLLQTQKQRAYFIKIATGILLKNENSNIFNLALGITYYNSKMLLEAKNHIELCIADKPSVDAYLYLLFIAIETNDNKLKETTENNLRIKTTLFDV